MAVIGVIVFVLLAIALAFFLKDGFQTPKSLLRRPLVGEEALRDKTAVARTPLKPDGMVLLDGELWTAVSEDGHLEEGAIVRVKRVEGLRLRVERKKQPGGGRLRR